MRSAGQEAVVRGSDEDLVQRDVWGLLVNEKDEISEIFGLQDACLVLIADGHRTSVDDQRRNLTRTDHSCPNTVVPLLYHQVGVMACLADM